MNIDIEKDFLSDLLKNDRVILAIGMKSSGKTTLLINFIKYAMYKNLYNEYYLFLPSYEYEQNNLYDFLKQSKNVFVYDKYHEVVSEKILKSVNKKKRIFIGIDDSTSQLTMNVDKHLKKILTCSRHCRITTYICGHIARKEIGSFLRSIIDYLLFYSSTNDRMIKQIWEEYMSRYEQYKKYEDFSNDYKTYVDKVQHNGLIIDLQNKTYNFNIKDFLLNE